MTTYKAGDILLVEFPYVGGGHVQRRPALVLLDTGDADVVVARVATSMRSGPYEIGIGDWKGAGLQAPSVVHVHKMAVIRKVEIVRQLGALQPPDHQQVAAVLHQIFGNF